MLVLLLLLFLLSVYLIYIFQFFYVRYVIVTNMTRSPPYWVGNNLTSLSEIRNITTHETSHSFTTSTKNLESMMNPNTFPLMIRFFVFIKHIRNKVNLVVCRVQKQYKTPHSIQASYIV